MSLFLIILIFFLRVNHSGEGQYGEGRQRSTDDAASGSAAPELLTAIVVHLFLSPYFLDLDCAFALSLEDVRPAFRRYARHMNSVPAKGQAIWSPLEISETHTLNNNND